MICTVLIACLAAIPAAADAAALTLVKDGKSPYVIVLPDQATVVEATAARELSPPSRHV